MTSTSPGPEPNSSGFPPSKEKRGGVRAPAIVQFGALAGDRLYLYIRGGWGGNGKPTGTITVIPTAT